MDDICQMAGHEVTNMVASDYGLVRAVLKSKELGAGHLWWLYIMARSYKSGVAKNSI